ncbi:MAG: DUF177 domain-containing protein [Oscillospiraceae bacterium]|nr:DUF177 domain-containing protein [Oscillospiraceae bacterium]
MRLNLNSILGQPGTKLPFTLEFSLPEAEAYTVQNPVHATGVVANIAGALTLTGEAEISMTCTCDRCISTFPNTFTLPVVAHLAEGLMDDGNPELFPIEGGSIDLTEIFTTAFFLDLDSRFLCDEDCAGLCSACGVNLNNGPCACKKEVDPRLAALQQLLDTN